jgi:hypothetical protein
MRIGKFNFAGAVPCGSPNTDFNHDDKPDYVLYNGATRQTAIWYMTNVLVSGAFGPTHPGAWNLVAL